MATTESSEAKSPACIEASTQCTASSSSSSSKIDERGAKRQKIEQATAPSGGVYKAHANMQGSNTTRAIVACGTTQEYRDAVRRI